MLPNSAMWGKISKHNNVIDYKFLAKSTLSLNFQLLSNHHQVLLQSFVIYLCCLKKLFSCSSFVLALKLRDGIKGRHPTKNCAVDTINPRIKPNFS